MTDKQKQQKEDKRIKQYIKDQRKNKREGYVFDSNAFYTLYDEATAKYKNKSIHNLINK